MIDTKAFYDALKERGLDFCVGVPDSLLKNLCACIKENSPAQRNIIAANEGNAVGIAAGYHVATGKRAVVYMQNSGLGNAVNPLLSLADEEVYRIPMLLVVGWRGEPGVRDEPQHVKQGKLTLPLLETMGIEAVLLEDGFERCLDRCLAAMDRAGKPVALVVRKGAFSPYGLEKPADRFAIRREEALARLLESLEPEAYLVTTTGKTSRELFELRAGRGEGHERDFLTVGSMGHTASIALGMSLGTERNVYCVDGDGSFLMHLGGMGVAARNAGGNFKYILINNGAHESVGGQPTIALDIDGEGVLRDLGFGPVLAARTGDEVAAAVARLRGEPRGALVIYVNQGSREDLGRPTVAPEQNKQAMMAQFRAEGAER